MNKEYLSQNRYKRYLYEFLFALNMALAFRWERAQTSFSVLEPKLQYQINSAFRLHPHNYFGGYVAFFMLTLLLGLCIFVFVRLLSLIPLADKMFHSVAGSLSLIALPGCWLYVSCFSFISPSLPNLPRTVLFVELAASIACAVLYLLAKRPLPGWVSVALLALHFCFWYWVVFGGFYFWRAPMNLVFPIAGFCACVSWAIYLTSQRNRPPMHIAAN